MSISNLPYFYLFKIPTDKKDIIKICYENKEKIIDYLLKKEVFVTANERSDNSFSSRIVATFLPKRFDIIIKNGYAYFYLKEKK